MLYFFAPKTQPGSLAHQWAADAGADDLQGTLADAQQLAAELACDVELRDAPGFRRGTVQADGTYWLS